MTDPGSEENFQRYVVMNGKQLVIVKGPRHFTFDEPEKGLSFACQEMEAVMLLDNVAAILKLDLR